MTNTDIDSPSGRRVWPKLLAASTVTVGMSTVLLHFLGMVVHRAYLAAWSVNSTQFPKSTDWLLLNGYYGIWNGLAMLFLALLANFHWIALGVITLLIYVRLLTSPWDPFAYFGAKISKLRKVCTTPAAMGTDARCFRWRQTQRDSGHFRADLRLVGGLLGRCGRTHPRASCKSVRRTIHKLLNANSVCNCAVFFARPR